MGCKNWGDLGLEAAVSDLGFDAATRFVICLLAALIFERNGAITVQLTSSITDNANRIPLVRKLCCRTGNFVILQR
jgi:hypothetical protein